MNVDDFSQGLKMFAGAYKEEETRIKVIGVGGAGTNAVVHMKLDDMDQLAKAGVNTDAQALNDAPLEETCMIGRSLTRGLSAGGDVEIGRKAAMGDYEKLRSLVVGYDLIFLVVGLGGGTGTGAAPVIAEVASEIGAMTIAFATMPFTMEDNRRMRQAEEGLVELRKHCHAVISLPNDLLLQQVPDEGDTPVLDAFALGNAWIASGIQSISRILFRTGLINLDLTTLRQSFAKNSGKTLFGLGYAEGNDSVEKALDNLFLCPLLHVPEAASMADRLLINIVGGAGLGITQVNRMVQTITERLNGGADTVIGAVIDERMGSAIEICVLGTTDIHQTRGQRDENVAAAKPSWSAGNTPEVPKLAPGSPAVKQLPVHHSKLSDKNDLEVQDEFLFVNKEEQRGYFDDTEKNLFEGQDLDVPTYLRRAIKVKLT